MGTDIAAATGANSAYAAGYTGAGVVVANIEAGYVWTGHDTTIGLGASTLDFHAPTNNATTAGWADRHATWVGQEIAGQGGNAYQRGIAYGATLWSGAIATSWNFDGTGFSGSFEIASNDAFFSPYYQASLAGVSVVNGAATPANRGTADVITSSWGYGSSDQRELGGNNYFSIAIDAMAAKSGKLFVFAAGNDGGGDTIGCPANGSNTLTVGALTGDQNTPAYNASAPFSSRGPQNFFIPASADGSTGLLVFVSRARIDISAPGDNLTLALYGGTSGGNALGTADGSTNSYSTGEYGTSFATPIVASAAALVAQAGKEKFAADPHALDGRVVKAVLMNSADKTEGWSNATTPANGVLRTTQGLDLNVGAGRVNAGAALANYFAGTSDLPGSAGGTVAATGWDYGEVAAITEAHNDYVIEPTLAGGTIFTATLSWYADGQLDLADEAGLYGSFFDLDLQLLTVAGTLIAESASPYNSSEQIYISLPSDGEYVLRVAENGAVWDFTGDADVPYGLAWNGVTAGVVPDPGTSGTLLCSSVATAIYRGRRRGR